MKKLTLVAALVASSFAVGANASSTSATVNITGKVIPGACTITANGVGGTIDFGTIKSSELTGSTVTRSQKASLSIDCQTDTTAFVKVSGSNGISAANNYYFATDQEFANYAVNLSNITASGGNTDGSVAIPDTGEVLTLENIGTASLVQAGNGKSLNFPANGQYFTPKASGGNRAATFRTLNADLTVIAKIDSAKAKEAVKGGEKVFTSVATFELNYI